MLHGLAIWLGLTNPTGRAYLFWSGIGGDLSLAAAPIVVFEYWRRTTCDVPGCRRLARRKAKDSYGDTHSVCLRHRAVSPSRLDENDERPLV